ncbi:hypothetical protein EDM56_25675 [Brevibacillus fluminis]|uniref:Uncharacterized protein n=1 Tax=Brevibacillus fluminis TaxID=511487 RepID=A0A3M8D0M6_9BACL|nr:hypothetical protein [Brevibacillus fluminis]RNB81121.1 hypothetical protein EDM56_25675 [Brevibacillus fluminis]
MGTGFTLVEKWIEKNGGTLSQDEVNGMVFVYGDEAYRIEQKAGGDLDVVQTAEKVVVFRNNKHIQDEYTCRICGEQYKNMIDTIRCCMHHDE